jgi:ArsR family transcriptional regulator, arsenate/arsenite/antimonite-responsive transcriptional repressor
MDLAKICNALGNETRFQLIKAMKDRTIGTCCDKIQYFEDGISVADVVTSTGLAQSTVSQHLMVLEQVGIIKREKRSQWTVFFLNHTLLEEFSSELETTLCRCHEGGCEA